MEKKDKKQVKEDNAPLWMHYFALAGTFGYLVINSENFQQYFYGATEPAPIIASHAPAVVDPLDEANQELIAALGQDPDCSAEQVKLLLKKGANVNASDKTGWTPLHFAALLNRSVEVTNALLAAGAEVNAQSDAGMTPLMWAAHKNSVHVVKALLAAGAEVNAAGNVGGITPLMFSTNSNTPEEILLALLDAGANVMARDERGWTALDWAKGNDLYQTEAYQKLYALVLFNSR